MKLYTRIKNSKGKIESMGDNEAITIELSHGNKLVGTLDFTLDEYGLLVLDFTSNSETQRIVEGWVKSKSQKGEKMYPYGGTMIKHCPECGRT